MELQNFSLEKMNDNQMWFMLQKQHTGPISIVRRTPAGDEIVDGVNCYQMNNGYIIVGIDSFTRFTSRHNLYAVSNGIEEVVNIQMFENIMDKYDAPVDHVNKGYFFFTDSIVIAPEDNWRCDNTRYGPLSYGIAEGVQEQLTVSLAQIVAYDPILSVDGIAHLLYLHFKDDEEYRYTFVNTLELPICAATISEALKLITEWAIVSQEPFNNQQLISQDAKDFIAQLDFDTALVDYQTDMYVAEFLKGNVNARQRPENVQPLSPELDFFIKKNMAYRCLSALISLYPDAWDLQEIVSIEKQVLNLQNQTFVEGFFRFVSNNVFADKENIWNFINKDHHSVRFHMFYTIAENADLLYEKVKTTGSF